MKTHLLTAGLALAALASGACARTVQVESAGDVATDVTPATSRTLPAGSTLEVELTSALGTKQSKVGDTFTARVKNALYASNGDVVVPAGAMVHGRVTGLDDSDHANDQAAIRIDFDRLSFHGRSYAFRADVVSTETPTTSGSSTNETLGRAAAGAAVGAVLGAVIGDGDMRDVLIGGALGAAAGTIISLGAGDVDATLPAGTDMTLRATQSVTLR